MPTVGKSASNQQYEIHGQEMNARSISKPFTLLTKHSDCHPSKRKEEIARFGNPEFHAQATVLLEVVSRDFSVSVFPDDSLPMAIVRGVARHHAEASDTGEWTMSAVDWEAWTGLKRHRLDGAKKALTDAGELVVTVRDFPPRSYCQCFHPVEKRRPLAVFNYYAGLSRYVGHEAAALFSWLLEVDREFDSQGYFFHLKMADIQRSLGLSRYQVDQARKRLIERDLMKERFWGIPAVREFRLRLEGLELLISEGGALR